MIESKYKSEELKIEANKHELAGAYYMIEAGHNQWIQQIGQQEGGGNYGDFAFLGALEDLGGYFYNLAQKRNKGDTTVSLSKVYYYSLMRVFHMNIGNIDPNYHVDRNSLFSKLHQEGTNLRWEGYAQYHLDLLQSKPMEVIEEPTEPNNITRITPEEKQAFIQHLKSKKD